jgi:acylphosphatase
MTVPPRAVRHAIVSGRVQGVWYRGWTVETARALGLAGFVRNLPDGSVEAVFAGPADAVDAMLDACKRGPPSARVTQVATGEHSDENWTDFRQLPDGAI